MKSRDSGSQPCWRAITDAIVWLPLYFVEEIGIRIRIIRECITTDLPGLEIPIVVPLRSSIELYFESLPVITALQRALSKDRQMKGGAHQFSGVVT